MSWLAEYVDVRLSPEGLAERLTLGGFEVEAILRPSAGVRGVVVAEVRSIEPLPGSDRLWLVDVFDGGRDWEIVCGANNFAVGDRVPAALPGANLPGGIEIGARRLRGVTSNGMLASPRELGIGDDHRGIWVLERDAPLGADLEEWLGLDDAVLDLAVTPDRGYALSMLGIARDVSALTGAELKPLPQPALRIPDDAPDLVAVAIADGQQCPRFSATEVAGVRVGTSPAWLQRRLAACGMRPRSNVVDATNHAMLETGHPAHAYDRARLAGPEFVVRKAEPGETLLTIDGDERRLDPDDLVIADADGVVGLAGVMGGRTTEVSAGTVDVVVEVASFDAATVLRAARRHGLITEASTRFEKIVPDETVPFGSDRCVQLLIALAGGAPAGRRDVAPAPRPRPGIALRPERLRRLLGMEVSNDRQAEVLELLGCEVRPAGGVLAVIPPAFRPDLVGEADLAEEVARIDGYDKVPETLPAPPTPGGRLPRHRAELAVRHALAGAGWDEVLTFPFVADADLAALGLDERDPRRRPVALANPLSQEESILRTTLLPGLFRTVRRNVNRQTADLAIFEIGHVFLPPSAAEPGAAGGPEGIRLPAEPLMLGLAATGAFQRERWDAPPRDADLEDVLGAADTVRRALGLAPFEARATEERPYHPGRAARLFSDGIEIGTVGELHPRVIDAFELPARTLAGELRLDRLVAGGISPAQASAPSPLPSLRVDVAAVVDEDVPAAEVEAAVRTAAGTRLSELTLFDIYRGAQLGEGRKSLAYRLRLDDPQHQLTADDGQAIIDAVDTALAERVGGTLRR
jgi:phenylalanyl-tRNA synthetase beta chain